MASGYTLAVQQEGSSRTERCATLDDAFDALQAELNSAGPGARRGTVNAFVREYQPDELVAMRLEIRGRRVSGGIDLRGDGSQEPYTGRIRRRPIECEPGENAVGALRRVLRAQAREG